MITLLTGDCRAVLETLPDQSVQTVITSPPYYGLRVYNPGDPREIGQEATPSAYVAALVAVFAEVWRVLRDDGTLWLNLGDSYSGSWGNYGGQNRGHGTQRPITNGSLIDQQAYTGLENWRPPTSGDTGLPPKNLLGIPWRVAFALQDAGWILRSDIIWSKPNPMPESVRDRPTRAHEYMFLFAKRQRYYYDATAIADPSIHVGDTRHLRADHTADARMSPSGRLANGNPQAPTRNKRSVWTIATQPYAAAHFATMPEALVEPCILAGSAAQACETCGAAWTRVVERDMPSDDSERPQARRAAQLWRDKGLTDAHLIALRAVGMADTGKAQHTMTGYGKNTPEAQRLADEAKIALGGYVREFCFGGSSTTGFAPACACETNTGSARSIVLDPFGGAGTVAKVAERFQRDSILIDLNAAYVKLQEQRTNGVQVDMLL